MDTKTPEYLHPALRPGYHAAVAEETLRHDDVIDVGELGDRVTRITQAVMDPRKAAYQALVNLFLAKAPAEGYDRIEQMPPLSGLQRGVILEACPDVQNDFIFEPLEIAAVLRGDIDARTWLSASTENALHQWLMDDVNREVAKDAEILRQSAFDPEESVS